MFYKSSFSKYNAKKIEYNGVVYDSKFECQRRKELDLLVESGAIKDLEVQKRFVLQEKFVNNQGKHIREIAYVADFYYYDVASEKWVVEDTKSPVTRTQVYMVKKKMFEYKYRDITFIEVVNGKKKH